MTTQSNSVLALDSVRSKRMKTMDTQNEYNFAITTNGDAPEAVKHLTFRADSEEVALDFANQALDEFKAGLTVVLEQFS